jgi:hypothetical protein
MEVNDFQEKVEILLYGGRIIAGLKKFFNFVLSAGSPGLQ